MFCPKCGSTQSDELKFCKACGANLFSVRTALQKPDAGKKFDWNKTWVAEMLLSGDEAVKRAAEIERLQGLTPEVKRRNEIKAGVITGSVGIALIIVLFVLMQGIILGGGVSDRAAQILARLWVVGVLPLLVGVALIVNGMFVSKRGDDTAESVTESSASELETTAPHEYLPPADTTPLGPGAFSVTDETTKHLKMRR